MSDSDARRVVGEMIGAVMDVERGRTVRRFDEAELAAARDLRQRLAPMECRHLDDGSLEIGDLEGGGWINSLVGVSVEVWR